VERAAWARDIIGPRDLVSTSSHHGIQRDRSRVNYSGGRVEKIIKGKKKKNKRYYYCTSNEFQAKQWVDVPTDYIWILCWAGVCM